MRGSVELSRLGVKVMKLRYQLNVRKNMSGVSCERTTEIEFHHQEPNVTRRFVRNKKVCAAHTESNDDLQRT